MDRRVYWKTKWNIAQVHTDMVKKAALLLMLSLLAIPINAQIMKANSTTMKTTVVPAQPSDRKNLFYVGMGYGTINTVKDFTQWSPKFDAGFVEFGFAGTLADYQKSVVPIIGLDLAAGIGTSGLYIESGPFVGLLIGKPTFRFDMRIQPAVYYCNGGKYYEKELMYGLTSTAQEDYFNVLFALDAGVWIHSFNVGIKYVPLYKGIMGHIRWRF